MKLILKANLTNDTPVFLGGYDTLYVRDGISEGLRSQSLKGLMRYWMRVYFATQGYELEEINERTNLILGGKIRNEKNEEELLTSKIKIRCYTRRDKPLYYSANTSCLKDIPRIELLTLRKRGYRLNYAEVLESELSLYDTNENLADKDKKLVIGSLVTGIILSGIGKMSRRGFGCFSMEIIEEETRKFREKVNKVFSSSNLDEKITNIKEIINATIECIPKGSYDSSLPPIHSFSQCIMYMIDIIKNKMEVIRDLQEFTVRSRRQKSLKQSRNDIITTNHLAWFLGLPRKQPDTGYTGYINNNKVERRASPMFIAVHTNFVIITIFKSKDWPERIKWQGKSKKDKDIIIKDDVISEAYDEISNELKVYLQNKGYEVKEIVPV